MSEWPLERTGQWCDNGLPAATHSRAACVQNRWPTHQAHSHFIVRVQGVIAVAIYPAVIYYYCFCAAVRDAPLLYFGGARSRKLKRSARFIASLLYKGKPHREYLCAFDATAFPWTRTPFESATVKMPPHCLDTLNHSTTVLCESCCPFYRQLFERSCRSGKWMRW